MIGTMRTHVATVASTVALLAAADAARADDAGPVLFDPAKVVTVDLTLAPEAIAGLQAEPETYQPATFALQDGATSYGPLEIGVRLKGSGSFRPITGKAAFKLKFAHSVAKQRFLGQKGMTLNNMAQDASWMHETLAYESFRAAGIPAARTGFAYVRVNGAGYGVYLNLEPYDDVWLPRVFPTTQHLYEGELGDDVKPNGAADFEVDEGEKSDVSDLQALIDAVTTTNEDGFAAIVDGDEMTRMWAIEQYLGHWDSYSWWRPNNYYLHSDATGRFSMVPSGTDQTFVVALPFAQDGGGILFRRCIGMPSCRARFAAQVADVSSVIDGLVLQDRIDALAATLTPWVSMPSRETLSEEDWRTAVESTRAFVSDRPGQVNAWLAAPQPPPPPAAPPGPPPPPPAAGPSAVAPVTAVPPAATPVRCRVPDLRGRTLGGATRRLRAAHCAVGKVRRIGRGRLRVSSTYPRRQTMRRAGTRVRVTLRRTR